MKRRSEMLIDRTNPVSFGFACAQAVASCPQLDWAIGELRKRFGDHGLTLSDDKVANGYDRPSLVLAVGPSAEIAGQVADAVIELPEGE